jgi:hypothetical protein
MHAPNPNVLKKLNFPSLFQPRRLWQKKPVPYGTGQKQFQWTVRTGLGSEPVGPAGFTGSSSVLVTLVMI